MRAQLLDKSSTALQVHLSPPSQPWHHTFPVTRYLLQWSRSPLFPALPTQLSWTQATNVSLAVFAAANDSVPWALSADGGPSAIPGGRNTVTAYPLLAHMLTGTYLSLCVCFIVSECQSVQQHA